MRQQRVVRGSGFVGIIKAAAGAAVTIGAIASAVSAAHAQSVYDVVFQSSAPLTGTLLFDLTNGDAAANNSVSIASGAFASVLLTETNPNALVVSQSRLVTNITSLAFRLTLSQQFVGGSPDEFAFFFFNPAQTLPVVPTSDPTGANALFTVDITGAPQGSLQVFPTTLPAGSGVRYSVTPSATNPVPEPNSAVVLGACLSMTGLVVIYRRRRPAAAAPL